MQVPAVPGPGVELQDAMQRLDISRDPRRSQQPPAPPQPQPQTRPPQQPAQSSRESSRATSDHRHHHNEGGQTDTSQSAAQLESALKASHEQVWYLKSIDFVSPSGASRKYNIILQNYNGCASPPPPSLSVADIHDGEKAMFVHCNMQYPDPPRTDRDPSTRSQNRFIRLSRSTRWRAYPSYCARCGRVCSAIDDASNHE